MSRDTDQLNRGRESPPALEDILAEFGGQSAPTQDEVPSVADSPAPPAADLPGRAADNVVEFPRPDNSVTARLGRLLRRADEYAEHMFDEEEPDPAALRAEQLLPGVDWERDTLPPRRRSIRPLRELPPDTPPAELARSYGKGLKFLWLRTVLAFLLAALLLYITICIPLGLPLGDVLSASFEQTLYLCAALLGGVCLLALDLLGVGIRQLFLLRLEWETVAAFAAVATLVDTLTMPRLGVREQTLPYCAAAAAILFFGLLGRFHKQRGMRHTARSAAAAKEPYAVTLDPDKWNHRDAFLKHSRGLEGYGSQIQACDGGARIYHIAAPLLLISCVLFSLLASASAGHPERLAWCLSATLCAASGFSGLLIFSLPFSLLARRLARSGAALGGWDGLRDAGRAVGVVLTDSDLFPPGAVTLNGIKVFGDFELTDVASCTATLIRASGSGLERLFHDLVRTQGAVYRRCDGVTASEGGCEAVLQRRRVLVGTAAFMVLMDVELPQGLSVKNAVFCAIDGELAGIFALNYALHGAVRPALGALLQNRLPPVLATRDPSVIPAMLRQRFKLPVERMEFPEEARRRALSSPGQEHSPLFAALLCREGVSPYAEAVVGGKRLVRATKLGAALALLGAAIGVLLCFYLTYIGAYRSLAPQSLLLFLGMLTVPSLLIAGWVNRY